MKRKSNFESFPAKKKAKNTDELDPSTKYLKDPLSAPIVKEAQKFFLTQFNYKLSLKMGPKEGWRTIAKLPVRRMTKELSSDPIIGLFVPGTRKPIPMTSSKVHHPLIDEFIEIILNGLKKFKISGYSDEDGSGDMRYIQMSICRSTLTNQITFVWNHNKMNKAFESFIEWLKDNHKDEIHSLWIHFRNAKDTYDSAIFGRDENSFQLLFSKDKKNGGFIEDNFDLNESSLFFSPSVFKQANIDQFQKIVEGIRKRIPKKSKIIELYAGVGTIGFNVVDLTSSIFCSDENPGNLLCFNKSLESLENKKKITYKVGSASDILKSHPLSDYDVIIVDPARKGLDEDVITAFLKDDKPKLLFYVSCGFKSFQRDSVALTKNGKNKFNLIHAEGHMLFPGSDHLETFAVFERN
jgi:23S rRNA (uracil1939-C5)-methyltransferase